MAAMESKHGDDMEVAASRSEESSRTFDLSVCVPFIPINRAFETRGKGFECDRLEARQEGVANLRL